MLPDQNRKYGASMRLVAALPLVVVLAAGITLLIHFAAPSQSSSGSSATSAVSTVTDSPSGQAPEASVTYPGAADITIHAGTVASMTASDPLSAGMASQVSAAAKQYASAPVTSIRFGTTDDPSTVLSWYNGWLGGRGWCAPSIANTNPDLHVYVRAQRDAYALIILSVPSLTGGSDGSSVIASYLQLPAAGAFPAC